MFSRDREGRLLNEVAQFPDESPFSLAPNEATASTEEGAKMAAVLKAATDSKSALDRTTGVGVPEWSKKELDRHPVAGWTVRPRRHASNS